MPAVPSTREDVMEDFDRQIDEACPPSNFLEMDWATSAYFACATIFNKKWKNKAGHCAQKKHPHTHTHAKIHNTYANRDLSFCWFRASDNSILMPWVEGPTCNRCRTGQIAQWESIQTLCWTKRLHYILWQRAHFMLVLVLRPRVSMHSSLILFLRSCIFVP